MIEMRASKKGNTIISVNGKLLHSMYDPQKEAIKFVDTQLSGNESPATIIVLGEGLGYLSEVCTKKYTNIKIISVYYSTSVYSHTLFENSLSWHPDCGVSLSFFLHETIDETECQGFKIIEWPASKALFPDMSRMSRDTVSLFLKEMQGNIRTTEAMGRLWIRNSICNFINIDNVFELKPFPLQKPVLLAGSGPTLQKALNIIKKYRKKMMIVALPSSLDFFNSMDIVPDLIVLTDPVYYSFVHLESMKNTPTRLCMPISASRGSWKFEFDVSFIAQPHFFETEILAQTGMRVPMIPPQGTVASTALNLALCLSPQKVVCAGLDFSYDDIISHVRPNTFERLLETDSNRLLPFYAASFKRAMHLAGIKTGQDRYRTSVPLKTYAGWFNSLDGEAMQRVFQLNPSLSGMNKIKEIEEPDFCAYLNEFEEHDYYSNDDKEEEYNRNYSYPIRRERIRRAVAVLNEWKTRITNAVIQSGIFQANKTLLPDSISEIFYFCTTFDFLEVKKLSNTKPDITFGMRIRELAENSIKFIDGIISKISVNL
jgi:hypothetical protein